MKQAHNRKRRRKKEKPEENLLNDPAGRPTSFFLDSAILFVSPPLLPRVGGMGCHDRLVKNPKRLFQDAHLNLHTWGSR